MNYVEDLLLTVNLRYSSLHGMVQTKRRLAGAYGCCNGFETSLVTLDFLTEFYMLCKL